MGHIAMELIHMSSSSRKPRVSIGLPVYNGENFVRDALDSILAQTFDDFELIISDNASTDRTQAICKSYASKDSRIHYSRNEQNLGAAKNFNRVFELSSGEYFKWASHDDTIAPEYIQKCVEVLDDDASVILCHPKTQIVDQDGRFVENKDARSHVDSPKPHHRLRNLLCRGGFNIAYPIFGLIRRDVLADTPLIDDYVASDLALLVRLSLRGRFHEIPERLFSAREHPQRSIRAQPLHMRAGWFNSKNEGKIAFPKWRLLREYLKAIREAPIAEAERLACYRHTMSWCRKNWRRLAYKEVELAAKVYLRRSMRTRNRPAGIARTA